MRAPALLPPALLTCCGWLLAPVSARPDHRPLPEPTPLTPSPRPPGSGQQDPRRREERDRGRAGSGVRLLPAALLDQRTGTPWGRAGDGAAAAPARVSEGTDGSLSNDASCGTCCWFCCFGLSETRWAQETFLLETFCFGFVYCYIRAGNDTLD